MTLMSMTRRLGLAALLAATALPAAAQELQMWERTGGNAGMVDALVAAWNEKNPDRKINLTYIPHAEMVPKIAQAMASGEVPDLMGMDLIYAPQFEAAGQLEDITDKIKDWPELATASPGHMAVSTYEDRLYGVPLYADVSALFWNKDLFRQAGLDPEKPPTSLAEIREYADKITALGGDVKGYFLPGSCAGCNIFTVGPLMWASGATIEPEAANGEPLQGEGVKEVLQWARDMIAAGNVHEDARAETGETFIERFGSGKVGMMGTGNFNITHRPGAEPRHGLRRRAAAGRRERPGRVLRRRRHRHHPQGQQARRRRRRLHEVPAVGRGAGRGLRQDAEHDHARRHGRQQVLPGEPAGPGRRQGDRRSAAPPTRSSSSS